MVSLHTINADNVPADGRETGCVVLKEGFKKDLASESSFLVMLDIFRKLIDISLHDIFNNGKTFVTIFVLVIQVPIIIIKVEITIVNVSMIPLIE